MTRDEKLKLCKGCSNDYYNRAGNSTSGECWLLASAKLVERIKVGVWQNPPYERRLQQTLNCHTPDGERWIKEDDCRVVGKTISTRSSLS